jgi:uncharacterized protein
MAADTVRNLKQQARLQLKSQETGEPLYELKPPDPERPRRGFELLPSENPADVWFDMEGYPAVKGGLEYLFGASYLHDDGQPGFADWWAHDGDQEKIAFERFIDWVYPRWKANPGMHIYHYAPYEVTALKRLMGRHATREQELDDLLRHEAFVDLYKIVQQALCVGEPRYSIKNIERFYGEKRLGDVANAVDSIVFYARWLEAKDGDTWHESTMLKDIRDYNHQDCDSTMKLTSWLRSLRQLHQAPAYLPKEDPRRDVKHPDTERYADTLALKLLSEIPTVIPSADEGKWKVHELLAHLLGFHWRELKPEYWAMYERLEMSEIELLEDVECLAGLSADPVFEVPKQGKERKKRYKYTFDPSQDSTFSDDKGYLTPDRIQAVVREFQRDNGVIVLSVSDGQGEPPRLTNLIPKPFYPNPLPESVLRVVQTYHENNHLPQSIADFLFKREPCIKGRTTTMPIVPAVEEPLPFIIEAVAHMDNTTLCIQGPPGSGKTFVGANVITNLLKNKKKVGITSNSHKALENLAEEAARCAQMQGVTCNGVKLGRAPAGSLKDLGFDVSNDADDVFGPSFGKYNLIAATAYKFASESAIGKLDYLFVDEAGQVSIANLVAMSECTDNIVLLGDQMQLDQPTKGSHPGESGLSTLSYLIGEEPTIAPNRGIFLDKTWRMHPDVCSTVSGAVYDNKLQSVSKTKDRVLILPPQELAHIKKNAGIIFIDVPHFDNSRKSPEEAAKIETIVSELLECQVKTDDGTRKMDLSDILIVTPYNAQVNLIKSRLPESARVASVDKFQGQQAPVVILSMCASDAKQSPRGLDFLFSKNRLNVAISRAMTMAIVVGNRQLLSTECTSIDQMALVDFFCRIVDTGEPHHQTPRPRLSIGNRSDGSDGT